MRAKATHIGILCMKNYCILLLIIVCTKVSAVTQDSVIASIHYMASIKEYQEKDASEDEMILDIARNKSVFYDRWKQAKKEIIDSVKNARGDLTEMLKTTADIPHPSFSFYIYNNYPRKGLLTKVEPMHIYNVYYTDSIEPISWELTQRDTIIAEYHCQSATGLYRGHTWNVYYTTDIPFSVGPWKLQGLPGAILYAKEESGNFIFDAIEVRTVAKKLIQPDLSKKVFRCTKEEFKKLKIEQAHNLLEFLEKRFGTKEKAYNADGSPLIYKHKTALFMED